ncbi:hypothetical protein T484DRAFT_3647067, partial [Baffinella frigidus]
GGESKSILQQVASQEKRIVELNKTLNDRNQTLAKFQTEKKTEMEALMAGMKQWIGNLDVKNEGHKDEFEKGLQRLVDTSSFDNGVWQVMVSASACAAKKEEDYQALKIQFEELNQQKVEGCSIMQMNAWVSSVRPMVNPIRTLDRQVTFGAISLHMCLRRGIPCIKIERCL